MRTKKPVRTVCASITHAAQNPASMVRTVSGTHSVPYANHHGTRSVPYGKNRRVRFAYRRRGANRLCAHYPRRAKPGIQGMQGIHQVTHGIRDAQRTLREPPWYTRHPVRTAYPTWLPIQNGSSNTVTLKRSFPFVTVPSIVSNVIVCGPAKTSLFTKGLHPKES